MRFCDTLLLAVVVAGALAIGGAVCLSAEGRDPVDRILAVVDDDPILASEAERASRAPNYGRKEASFLTTKTISVAQSFEHIVRYLRILYEGQHRRHY